MVTKKRGKTTKNQKTQGGRGEIRVEKKNARGSFKKKHGRGGGRNEEGSQGH